MSRPRGRHEEASMVEIQPIVDEGLGNAAWLVDLGDGRALVVDPSRDPTPYLDLATAKRLGVAFTLETHLHADFVSGSRELTARGAELLAPRAAHLEFAHRGVGGGEELDVGGLTLRAVATPGHAPEHLAYLLLDGNRPVAVFSGGALLVGAVARTDLVAPEQTRPLAQAAWRSARRLLELPDDLAVYPTHGAGSFCAAATGGQRATTIGAERTGNSLLAAGDQEVFTERLLDSLGSYPPYFLRLRQVNRHGPRVLDQRSLALRPLDAHQVLDLLAAGAVLIDARPIGAFGAEHAAGALSIALRPQFGTWLGWLVPPDRPLIFVLDDEQDRRELVRQCRTIGYERLAGELDGGMATWLAAGLPTRHIDLVGPDQADLADGEVLDVRQLSETAVGHLPGAHLVELGSLATTEPGALPNGPVTVMCGHGQRAMTAASVLARSGHDPRDLRVLLGGAEAWQSATGRPLVRG
jgi:hydroxyacylglutathione hydrolase